jgi:peptidylprolyl isomerase
MKLDRRQFAAGAAAMGPCGAALAQANDPENTVFLETKYGRVVIRLRPELAPKHVVQIKTLTKSGFYNGAPFHRVIDGFMAQTGDAKNKDGSGGSDLPNLPAEFTQTPFKRGTLGMARTSNPNSANSQFFICFTDVPHLMGQYTVFGEVVSGMEFVDKIKRGEPVRDPDVIVRMALASGAR